MRSLEEPDAPRGRGVWILLALALLVTLASWYAFDKSATPPAPAADTAARPTGGSPISGNESPAATERPAAGGEVPRSSAPRPNRAAGASSPPTAPASPAPAAREFRVTTDVPGAYVFLNRKFLGTTPFSSSDVAPGTYQLNVQIEGRPPVVRTVDVLDEGPTDITVTLPPAANTSEATAAIDEQVAVVHQHAMGSCEGVLRATGSGFRYETPHKDAFTLPFANVETFAVDYAEKRLRLKQRGGRTWNFTTRAATADPLFVFHRDVEATRR